MWFAHHIANFDMAHCLQLRVLTFTVTALSVTELCLSIQALNLTCNISGNPVPEVTWLKNDREITSDEHCILKFESGKFASFTITGVNTSDSGKYSILVKNKYGTESGDFTVSVFIPEEAGGKKK